MPPLRGLREAVGGRKGAPPVAESSDRSGWAGTCVCTSEAQGKCLVPTRTVSKLIFYRITHVIARPVRTLVVAIRFQARDCHVADAPRNDMRECESTRRGWPTDFPPVYTMDAACMWDVEDAIPCAKDAVLS